MAEPYSDDETEKFPGAGPDPASSSHPQPLGQLDQNSQLKGPKGDHAKRPQSKRPTKKIIIISVAVALIAAAAAMTWLLLFNDKEAVAPSRNVSDNAQEKNENSSPAQLANSELSQSHTNDFLRLTFKYPKDWKVSDQNDVIVVTSPNFEYSKKDGQETEGYFKVYIKQQATPDDGKFLGRGVAIGPSEKITYASPQPGQRSETFLTNFGLDAQENFAYFVVQGNFDLKPGDTLGPKFAGEAGAYLIAGGYSGAEQKMPLETNLVSLNYFPNDQAYKTALSIVKSLQLK